MTTEPDRSSRMFEPAPGAMFSDSANENPSASNADGNAADSQSMQQSTTAENPPAGPIGPNGEQPGGFGSAPGSSGGSPAQAGGADDGNGAGNDGGAQAGADDSSGAGGDSGAGAGDDTGSGGGTGTGDGSGTGNGGGAGNGDGGGGGNGSDIIDTVMQTVGMGVGSGGQLNDILNPTNVFGGLADGVGNGLGNGLVNGISDPLGANGIVDAASGLVNNVVSGVGQTAGAMGNGGSVDSILNAVGDGAGNLVDDVLGVVGGATGNGIVGGIVNGLGDNVVSGAVGGTGLLSGTPLEGSQGDGALLGAGLLQSDASSASNLIEVGAGSDTSQGLINVNAASDRSGSESNHVVDTNIGPDSSGNGVVADLLGADQDQSASLIDADAGQHNGPSLATINAGTAADQFQFPSLDGAGLDSLVGEIGPLPGSPVGGDLLPVSAGVDGHALIDIGADGTVDSGDTHIGDGTQIMVNTPLHGSLIA